MYFGTQRRLNIIEEVSTKSTGELLEERAV